MKGNDSLISGSLGLGGSTTAGASAMEVSSPLLMRTATEAVLNAPFVVNASTTLTAANRVAIVSFIVRMKRCSEFVGFMRKVIV